MSWLLAMYGTQGQEMITSKQIINNSMNTSTINKPFTSDEWRALFESTGDYSEPVPLLSDPTIMGDIARGGLATAAVVGVGAAVGTGLYFGTRRLSPEQEMKKRKL